MTATNSKPKAGDKAAPYKPFDPPNRFGWSFKEANGTLSFFSPSSIRTYRASPPTAWFKNDNTRQWRGTHGENDFEIGQLADANRRCEVPLNIDLKAGYRVPRPGIYAMKRFFHLLQPEVVELTRGLSSDSWLVYCLLVRVPELRELAAHDLALVMLMAHTRRQRRWRFDRIRTMAKRKRVQILEACGLPAEKQWLKLLRKIPMRAITSLNIRRLDRVDSNDPNVLNHLRHVPQINGGVLAVMSSQLIRHVHPSLLTEIANDPHQSRSLLHHRCHAEGLLSDIIRMMRTFHEPVPLFRSMQQLRAFHDEAAARAIKLEPDRTQPFGPPPLPETEHIVALRTPNDLREEAKQQRNCLASTGWADDCYDGSMYIYRVLHPERASVAVIKGRGGQWVVHEFKTRFNDYPSKATVRVVKAWLQANAPTSKNIHDPRARAC